MSRQPPPNLAAAGLDELTPRERDVLALSPAASPTARSPPSSTVEESTVRSHVKRILMKLGLRDRVQVVIFAYETASTARRSASSSAVSFGHSLGARRK